MEVETLSNSQESVGQLFDSNLPSNCYARCTGATFTTINHYDLKDEVDGQTVAEHEVHCSLSSSLDKDYDLAAAEKEARESGSITPLIKQELKLMIQSRRLSQGKQELRVGFEQPTTYELTQAEVDRRSRRKEQNRYAAKRFRQSKKTKQSVLEEEMELLEERNKELKEALEDLTRQKTDLLRHLYGHLSICSNNSEQIPGRSSTSVSPFLMSSNSETSNVASSDIVNVVVSADNSTTVALTEPSTVAFTELSNTIAETFTAAAAETHATLPGFFASAGRSTKATTSPNASVVVNASNTTADKAIGDDVSHAIFATGTALSWHESGSTGFPSDMLFTTASFNLVSGHYSDADFTTATTDTTTTSLFGGVSTRASMPTVISVPEDSQSSVDTVAASDVADVSLFYTGTTETACSAFIGEQFSRQLQHHDEEMQQDLEQQPQPMMEYQKEGMQLLHQYSQLPLPRIYQEQHYQQQQQQQQLDQLPFAAYSSAEATTRVSTPFTDLADHYSLQFPSPPCYFRYDAGLTTGHSELTTATLRQGGGDRDADTPLSRNRHPSCPSVCSTPSSPGHSPGPRSMVQSPGSQSSDMGTEGGDSRDSSDLKGVIVPYPDGFVIQGASTRFFPSPSRHASLSPSPAAIYPCTRQEPPSPPSYFWTMSMFSPYSPSPSPSPSSVCCEPDFGDHAAAIGAEYPYSQHQHHARQQGSQHQRQKMLQHPSIP